MTGTQPSIPISLLLNPDEDSLFGSPKLGPYMLVAPSGDPADSPSLRSPPPCYPRRSVASTTTLPCLRAVITHIPFIKECESAPPAGYVEYSSGVNDLSTDHTEESGYYSEYDTDSSVSSTRSKFHQALSKEFEDNVDDANYTNEEGSVFWEPNSSEGSLADEEAFEVDPYDISDTFLVHVNIQPDHDNPSSIPFSASVHEPEAPFVIPPWVTETNLSSTDHQPILGNPEGYKDGQRLTWQRSQETGLFSARDVDACSRAISLIFPGADRYGLEEDDVNTLKKTADVVSAQNAERSHALRYLLRFYPVLQSREDRFDYNVEFLAFHVVYPSMDM